MSGSGLCYGHDGHATDVCDLTSCVQIAGHYLRANTPHLAAVMAGYKTPDSLSNVRLQLLAEFGHRIYLAMCQAVLKESAHHTGGDAHSCTKQILDCVQVCLKQPFTPTLLDCYVPCYACCCTKTSSTCATT